MNCVTCGSDRWILPNGCSDQDGRPVPICEGCREVLVQFSLGQVHKVQKLSNTFDLADMSDKELNQLALDLAGA